MMDSPIPQVCSSLALSLSLSLAQHEPMHGHCDGLISLSSYEPKGLSRTNRDLYGSATWSSVRIGDDSNWELSGPSLGDLLTLPKTNMEVENHLFVVENGLPRGHSPLPC